MERINLIEQVVDIIGLPKRMVEDAVNFVGSLLKDPAQELSNIVLDDIRYLRVKNQVRLLNKAKEYFENRGIEPNKVPAKVIVPLLESCSLEEDLNLQERWTNLLINAAREDGDKTFLTSYIEILKQLSSEEARLLDFMYSTYGDNTIFGNLVLDEYEREANCNIKNYELYLDNFMRLNIIKSCLSEEIQRELEYADNFYSAWGENSMNYPYKRYNITNETIKFTYLGRDFIKNCRLEREI